MREKAANEAKSEFMSLMCHEVRTPLNGCLASAGAQTPPATSSCMYLTFVYDCSSPLHAYVFM